MTPSVLRASSPYRGEQDSRARPCEVWRDGTTTGETVFYQVPPPLWRGGQGEGSTITAADSAAVLSLTATLFSTDTPSALRTAPPQGGAEFLVSGPVAELAQPMKSRPAGIFEFPLPFGEGDRGRSSNPSTALFLTARLSSSRHPLSRLRDSSPSRGSRISGFWTRGGAGTADERQACRYL